jgi:hypothetical protein
MDSADPEILVVGYCMQANRIRAFKLFAGQADENGYSTYFKTEVLTDSQPCFLGSAKNDACKYYEEQTIKNPFRVIRQLIDDPNHIGIGGDIQFGDFNGHSFSVKGFQRPKMQDNRIEYAFAGLNVFDGDFSFDNTGLVVQIPCIAPFMEELFQDAFKNEDK